MIKDVTDFIKELDQENETFFQQLPDSATQYWHDHMSNDEA